MTELVRHYFVDEAGDSTLFNRRGKVIVGTPGCSRFFMLGLLEVPDPEQMKADLEKLRSTLLSDVYFKDVPSMQRETRKTAVAFHAKDDLPEVRREVFSVLKNNPGLRFFAVVTDKMRVLEYVRQRNIRDPAYRYHPNEVYDYLVRRLFRDRLHKADVCNIYFAKRGKADRTESLLKAVERARERFYEKWGIVSDTAVRISVGTPAQYAGLQAVDYFLWALQRLYERGEDRYLVYLWNAVKLIHDIDDTRRHKYGEYYNKNNPLTAESIKERKTPGI
ncbi:MAG: DUF3800 domain-containing protein [Nitrospiraceae bacterium]|nr:DUF3800 domain-containing protein [Nitrospiraceae bacterium]